MHNKKSKGLCGNPTLPNSSVASKTLAVTKTHHQNKLINCLAVEKFLSNVDQISSGLSFMGYYVSDSEFENVVFNNFTK